MLLIVPRPAALADQADLLDERFGIGDGTGGIGRQLGAADLFAKLRIRQTGEQRLARRRAECGRPAADLGIHTDGVDRLDLIDIDDLQSFQHGQMHGLLGQLQKPAQIGLRLGFELHLV